TRLAAPSKTAETPPRICCPPPYRSSSRCDNPPRHKRPSSRSCRAPGLPAVARRAPTCASAPDGGGSPSRPGSPVPRRHRRTGLFFQLLQLGLGADESGFIAFALHRVLGTLKGEPLLMQQAPQLVITKGDPRFLGQVHGQPTHRPDTEAVPQALGRRLHDLAQGSPISSRRPRHSPRRRAVVQPGQALLPV